MVRAIRGHNVRSPGQCEKIPSTLQSPNEYLALEPTLRMPSLISNAVIRLVVFEHLPRYSKSIRRQLHRARLILRHCLPHAS